MKNKWFGKCNICKIETTLATVKVTTGIGMNYILMRTCKECADSIHDVTRILLAALERKEEKK